MKTIADEGGSKTVKCRLKLRVESGSEDDPVDDLRRAFEKQLEPAISKKLGRVQVDAFGWMLDTCIIEATLKIEAVVKDWPSNDPFHPDFEGARSDE